MARRLHTDAELVAIRAAQVPDFLRNDIGIGKRPAAAYLGWSVKTLDRRIRQRKGPPFVLDGRKKIFVVSELKRYRQRLAENLEGEAA